MPAPPGETTHVFTATADHVGVEDYDVAGQLAVSRHYWSLDGQLCTFSSTHRYVWPAELGLMAGIPGPPLHGRLTGTAGPPPARAAAISVWEKPGDRYARAF